MSGKYILITRPVAEAVVTAKELKKLGFSSLISPMLEIVTVPFTLENSESYQAFIFTSANAVRVFSAANSTRNIPVYTVGQQTKDAAQEAGFKVAGSANGNSTDLDALLSQTGQGRALHIRGQDVTAPLTGTESLIVYKAELAGEFAPEIIQKIQNGGVEAVTFYSRRTALNFIKLIDAAGLNESLQNIKALCISNEVLECVQPEKWAETYAAERPDRKGMTNLVKRVCAP